MEFARFSRNLNEGEKRRVKTLAKRFRLEEVQVNSENENTEPRKSQTKPRLVYQNRFDEFVPVPKMEDINRILMVYHDAPCARHYAFDITYRKIYRRFYWPTLRHDVYTWVQTCDACQKAKDLTEFRIEPLRPIACLEPGEILTVDYAGPFNPSGPGGHQYCLFMIDNMTGWLEINSTISATRKATCALLEQNCYT
jgi:hypothetical protein